MLKIIAAVDEQGGIGKNNCLAWHYSEDLQYFKKQTHNSTIVMGHNTFKSLQCTPLKGRRNVVICRDPQRAYDNYFADDYARNKPMVFFYKDPFDPDIISSEFNTDDNIWYIGGAQLYKAVINKVDEIYLTKVPGTHDCDCFMPCLPINAVLKHSQLNNNLVYEQYVLQHHKK